jgi:hypothetical protein
VEELLLASDLSRSQRHRAGVQFFRRIVTRYDRVATNFHAAVCIVAAISFWL